MKNQATQLWSLIALLLFLSSSATAQAERKQDDGAWRSFYAGVELLEKGEPRAQVLAQWEATLREFPQSEYQHQLESYVAVLRQQVIQNKTLAASQPENGSLEKRIADNIARFPDVHGKQWSQPGSCWTLGQGDDTRWSDAIVKIGRPAVPALIEHLSDRRLTRSIGYWRNFHPHRTVLRVQDVAVQCLEAILKMRFVPNDQSYLSTASYPLQMRIIAQVRAWWTQNAKLSPLQGYLNRLRELSAQKAPFWERMQVLKEIERIDRRAVPSTTLIKQWDKEVGDKALRNSGDSYRAELALELMRRGDRSLLPEMQRRIRDAGGAGKYANEECIRCIFMAGVPDDFRVLRRRVLDELRHKPGLTASYQDAVLDVMKGFFSFDKPLRNTLAVPMLTDILYSRSEHGERGSGTKTVRYSRADHAMEVLVVMTKHDEGYNWLAPSTKRYAAIDRWLAWWKKGGAKTYLKQHPEVRSQII